MSQQKEWGPKYGGPDTEQITNVASICVLIRFELIVRVNARLHETEVGMVPILFKSQVVLDDRSPQVGVVPDSITMHQRIDKRQGSDKHSEQNEEMDPDAGDIHPSPLV
jgi:hypothetical protein